jgi:hypothetical protein
MELQGASRETVDDSEVVVERPPDHRSMRSANRVAANKPVVVRINASTTSTLIGETNVAGVAAELILQHRGVLTCAGSGAHGDNSAAGKQSQSNDDT